MSGRIADTDLAKKLYEEWLPPLATNWHKEEHWFGETEARSPEFWEMSPEIRERWIRVAEKAREVVVNEVETTESLAYDDGYEEGHEHGYNEGHDDGYESGYEDGLEAGKEAA